MALTPYGSISRPPPGGLPPQFGSFSGPPPGGVPPSGGQFGSFSGPPPGGVPPSGGQFGTFSGPSPGAQFGGSLGRSFGGPTPNPFAGSIGRSFGGPDGSQFGDPYGGTLGKSYAGPPGGPFGSSSMFGPLPPVYGPELAPPPPPVMPSALYGSFRGDPFSSYSYGEAFERTLGRSSRSTIEMLPEEPPRRRYDEYYDEPPRRRYEDHYDERPRRRYEDHHDERPRRRYEDRHDERHVDIQSYSRTGSSKAYDRDDYQTNPEYTSITQITECLYLTNRAGGLSVRTLKSLGINYIICAAESFEIPRPQHNCDFKQIPVPKDPSGPNIIQYFDEVADVIHSVEGRGGRVLIQSLNGVSRGPTLAIAYLMKHKKVSLSKAYAMLCKERPCIKPYFGFWKQLIRFEKELFGQNSATLE